MSPLNPPGAAGLPNPPVYLKVRFLAATLDSLQWVGPPGQESCLTCGSCRQSGHARGCPVAFALWPGRDRDRLDEAITEMVFLAASRSQKIFEPLYSFLRELEEIEELVTRIQCLLPRR